MFVIPVLLIKEHGHGFCRCCAFIQQGSIGERQTGEIADHGLEIQQAFQSALGNFSLVRRVLGIPSRIFKYIPEDDTGCDGIIITLADIIFEYPVFSGDFAGSDPGIQPR